MRLYLLMLTALASLTLCACCARNIKPGETPKSHEGIAYIRVILSGEPELKIAVNNKGSRLGSQKARVHATEGDHVYAVIMADGEYDIGGIILDKIFCGYQSIWPDPSYCPSFKVIEGKSTYIGTLELSIEQWHWYQKNMNREYHVKCMNTPSDAADALKMYESTYGWLREPVTFNALEPSR